MISPQSAYLITDILSDDVARQPAFGRSSILNLPFPAAVKTGTTTDWRDNWTVGYSTRRLVGVWVGNADNSPMVDVSGVDGAGPIWHDLMLLAHTAPPPAFARPAKIVETEICAASGMLPAPECPRKRWERFLAGTQPTQPDNQFQRLVIDRGTGQLATARHAGRPSRRARLLAAAAGVSRLDDRPGHRHCPGERSRKHGLSLWLLRRGMLRRQARAVSLPGRCSWQARPPTPPISCIPACRVRASVSRQ